MDHANREVKTVMHELKRRTLTVTSVDDLNSTYRRITFTSPDLGDFISLSSDDHLKAFFPSADGKPEMRDYTPRSYDLAKKELVLEFFLHAGGVGSSWARSARVGSALEIGGPRGSRVVPYAFDAYLMIGDETALPSIGRRLEEMPRDARSVVLVEVENESRKISLPPHAHASVFWIMREGRAPGSADGFLAALDTIDLPSGDFFSWIATEKACAKEIETALVEKHDAKPSYIKATAYWVKHAD